MATAVIEFNSLPDAVGAAAENHYLWSLLGVGLVFVFVSGIEIGREGFEFGGASVYTFEHRSNAIAGALKAHGGGSALPDLRKLLVARAVTFDLAQELFGSGLYRHRSGAAIHGDDFFDLMNEPGIDLSEFADFFSGQALVDRGEQPMNAVGARSGEFFAQQRIRRFSRRAPWRVWLKRANSLLQGFFEGAADGHDLANGLHLRSESAVCAGKLFELPLGNFYDHIVDGRFEAGRRFFGDVVGDFVKRHAHGQARSDFGYRKTGGFAGQSRAARNSRIHFNHRHAAVFGINGELYVRTTGLDADFANDGRSSVTHALVFLVGQSLRRGHGDGIAGMNAHGIEILDGANDHEVVAVIAHHFELVFFPSEDGFFDKGLVNGTHVQGVSDRFAKFFFVVGDGTARAAQGEGWADNQRKAELIAQPQGVLRVIDERGSGDFQSDFATSVLEPQPVFGNFDGAERCADHFDFIFFENAAFREFDSEIESCLAANRGQERVGLFAGKDFLQIFLGQRLDVGAVSQLRIGHDRGRIGIDQNDFVALGAQSFASLGAGIIKFASLADDDRARADDQNFLDVRTFWHPASMVFDLLHLTGNQK